MDAVGASYKVKQFRDHGLVAVEVFRSWDAANNRAEQLEELYPDDDIQLWVRER